MPKKTSYKKLVKKAISKAKFNANPQLAKANKKKKIQKMANKMSSKMTGPEITFSKMMKELGIEFEAQKVIENKIFDFYIPSKNMIVEVHGDYWHSNPIIYEEKELNNIQIRNLRNDTFKDILAKGRGYNIEVVWEYDLKNNYDEQKKRFKKILINE